MQKIQCGFCPGWFVVGILCCLILLSGCSHLRIPIRDSGGVFGENDDLKAAFNQYWQLMAGKEVKKTFAKEAPHVREMVSESRYLLYRKLLLKGDIQEVKALKVTCEKPFLCCVDCQITHDVRGRSEMYELRDCWVRVKGDWYHVFRSPLFFPM